MTIVHEILVNLLWNSMFRAQPGRGEKRQRDELRATQALIGPLIRPRHISTACGCGGRWLKSRPRQVSDRDLSNDQNLWMALGLVTWRAHLLEDDLKVPVGLIKSRRWRTGSGG